MGDSAPSTNNQAKDILGALSRYAPDAIRAISDTLGGTARSQLQAEQDVAPGYDELYRQNQLATAETEADVVEGPGGRLVSAADKYQKQLDPEFYSQRANISEAINKFLGGYDPSRLTPTEEAEIARGINATTGPVSESNLNTIRNAQTFGSAGTQRWANFGDAITKAAAAIPGLKSGVSGFDVARSRGSNTSASNAVGNALGTNFGFSTSALGNITGAANAALAKRKDAWDQALAGSQIFANVGQGVGGFAGAGASDRNLKENFYNVDPDNILEKLGTLDISSWNYIGDNTRHIGPMAQDFQEVFQFGNGKEIPFIDANGILTAAIQGLLARVKKLEHNSTLKGVN